MSGVSSFETLGNDDSVSYCERIFALSFRN